MTAHRKTLAGLPASPRVWVMLGAAVICVAGFFAVTSFVFDGPHHGATGPVGFDQPLAQFLQQYRTPALTGRVIEVSALGSAPVLALFALLAYSVVLRARDRLGLVQLSLVLVGAGIVSRLLQGVWDRARPEGLVPSIVVTPGSYPSAHLFGATACYMTYAFFYARYAGTELASYVLASILVVLIGLTRVYLGAHHATDVIAGITGGAAWALFVAAILSRWDRHPPARPSRER